VLWEGLRGQACLQPLAECYVDFRVGAIYWWCRPQFPQIVSFPLWSKAIITRNRYWYLVARLRASKLSVSRHSADSSCSVTAWLCLRRTPFHVFGASIPALSRGGAHHNPSRVKLRHGQTDIVTNTRFPSARSASWNWPTVANIKSNDISALPCIASGYI
jgi:hypothetical protein